MRPAAPQRLLAACLSHPHGLRYAPSVTVRPARESDIPRLMAIRAGVTENRLSDPATVTAPDYLPYIAAEALWVWEEHEAILGFAAIDTGASLLWALFVSPEATGRGIGPALLAQAVGQARAAGLTELRLATAPGTRAERLYRRTGWAETGRDPSGDLLMRLTL